MDLRYLFVWALFVVNTAAKGKEGRLKLCLVSEPRERGRLIKNCNTLTVSKSSPVSCVYRGDRLGCMEMVSNGEADFTIMEPEDLYMASVWGLEKLMVVSEMRDEKEQEYRFGTVAIVRNDSDLTNLTLKGKRMCHPGLKSADEAWNQLFAEYFEERVAPRYCEPELSVVEDRVKTSSEFFGGSCKPGPWADNATLDLRLKGDYQILCSACEEGDCRKTDKYAGHVGAALCLMDGAGEVLWARYDKVKSVFKKMEEERQISMSDYSFLCENGTKTSLRRGEPCFWLAMPWKVMAANPASVKSVQEIFYKFGNSDWERSFMEAVENYLHYFFTLRSPKTTEDYLRTIPGYVSAMNLSQGNCRERHAVRLCTSNPLEDKKCTWMSRAALSMAIQPPIECVEKKSMVECVESVANGTTDLVIVRPDYLRVAMRKHNLMSIYYELPENTNENYDLSVVVKDSAAAKRFSDLKRTKACFTRVDGVGWNMALEVMKANDLGEWSCSESEVLTSFFGDVCVVHGDGGGNVTECCGGGHEREDPDAEALACLDRGGCGVAFVDSSYVKRAGSKNLRSICKEDKDSGCSWYRSQLSHLMVSPDIKKYKLEEVDNVVFELSMHLGGKSKTANGIMRIFGPFHDVSNVLFRDETERLESTFWNPIDFEDDLLLLRSDQCSRAASLSQVTVGLVISVIFLSIFIR